VTLTFDLLTLTVMSESRVTCVISEAILVFLGLCILDLGPMNATDRHTSDVRQTSDKKHCLMPPPIRGEDIINIGIPLGVFKRSFVNSVF